MEEPTAYSGSLPHERELHDTLGMVMKGYETEDPNWLGLLLVDSYEQGRHILQTIHRGTKWDSGTVEIHREGIRFKRTGAQIIVRTYNGPELLRGLRPNQVLIYGRIAELLWNLEVFKSLGAEIEMTT